MFDLFFFLILNESEVALHALKLTVLPLATFIAGLSLGITTS